MKQHSFPFHFPFIFLFVLLFAMGGSAFNSFSQTTKTDTNYIITYIDSCKALGELQCGTDLLKLIQQKLTEVQNGKEKTFYQKAEITILRNTGNIYRNSFVDLSKAMEYYQMSRKKSEEIDDRYGLAGALLNIGIIYTDLQEYLKALEYQEKSLKMFREIGVDRGIGICLNNIGNIYKNKSDYPKALEYFRKSLIIQQERADTVEIMTCYNNIGTVYEKKKYFAKATEYYQMGLNYAKGINNTEGIINALSGIGNIFLATDKPNDAEQYYQKALRLATESENLLMQSELHNGLRTVFENQGRYKEAFSMYGKHIILRDSLFNQEKSRDIARKDAKYEFEKKEAEIKDEQKKKDAEAEAEKRKQQIITWAVGGALFLALLFAGFISRSLQVTRKQKTLIEEQKAEVDKQREIADSRRIIAEEQTYIIEMQKTELEQQKKTEEEHEKEIIDSITYAKRLQEAILPPLDFVKEHLPDSFILYKPKDIVAGDFYWMEIIDDTIFIAAADCTGHGVAGAMLSVVCSNAMNRTVREFGLRDTGKILDKVTELVVETFEKSDEDVKDGMDISILAIHKTTGQIQWSGANNPLLYIQNGKPIDITANKQPIGKHDNRKPFTTHYISHQPNTTFYLFTDGYADQFGGAKGKKFKYKQLEEQLLAMSNKQLADQHVLLDKIFADWKGNLEQVDDVCVIGIKS